MQLIGWANWIYLVAAIVLTVFTSGCGEQEESKVYAQASVATSDRKTPEAASYPIGDVRWSFIAKQRPAIDGNARVRLWAGSHKKDKPEVLVKELDYPVIEYATNGTLYFIGDNQDAIVAVHPDGRSNVVARSGVMGYATPDGAQEREPIYNTFEGLVIINGELLTLKNGAFPYSINLSTAEEVFVAFMLPSGKRIENQESFSYPNFSDYLDWQLKSIRADNDWIVIYNQADRTWYRFKKGGRLEKLKNPLILKNPDVYLNVAGLYGITGPDGYIYAVEPGKSKDEPDRILRIGDPGLSSLRKDATRVTIVKFKHGELTGSIAFSPKGELAVGAKNRIYLISPTATGKK